MKRHQEVRLTSRMLSAHQILEVACSFAATVAGWEPSRKGLQEDGLIGKYCTLTSLTPPVAAVALVAEGSGRKAVRTTNIVPRDKDHLPLREYNIIAQRFYAEFSHYCRGKIAVKVSITPEDRGLDAAICGAKCRRIFESYLRGHPLSFHPADIETLDTFTCAVHRYNSRCDTYAIGQYLKEDLGWKDRDAMFVEERIRVGLDILRVNRRF